MYDAIKNLCSQFEFEPVMENKDKAGCFDKFIAVGMGGSHLAADLIKVWNPYLDITVHQDYGLPALPEDVLKNSLIILSSYSGNTEEVLDAYDAAGKKGLSCAIISVGGRLLELAKKDRLPYIQLPNTGIQPRSAVGFMTMAFLRFIAGPGAVGELYHLRKTFHPEEYENSGQELAKKILGRIPIIYSSGPNEGIAKNWRVRFHETAKIPSYYNLFPELNHNEMTGFDSISSTRSLSQNFHFIFLKDSEDHPHVLKRMQITEQMFRDRKLPVEIIDLRGETVWHKIFGAISLADWTAYHTAKLYGTDPEQIPMVEEFKALIRS